MELFLLRFLSGASLVLATGLLGAALLRHGRGPAAACDALRIALAGVALSLAAAALPGPLAPLASVPLDRPNSLPMPIRPPALTARTPAVVLPSVPTAPQANPGESPLPLLTILLGVWALGTLAMLGQLLAGHALLRRLRRSSAALALNLPCPIEARESAALLNIKNY